jgi:hypothetical protein
MTLMPKKTAAALIIAAALAGACASNPARSSAAVPLTVPEPPPREAPAPIVAGPVTQAETPTPAPTPPPAPPPRSGQNPTPASSSPSAAVAPPAAPPLAAPAPASPAPELRPAGSSGRTPTGTQVLDSLERTKRTLDSIDRRRLSAGQSADYDSARRFLIQAADAVRANNLLLAQSSAEKAAALADGLR